MVPFHHPQNAGIPGKPRPALPWSLWRGGGALPEELNAWQPGPGAGGQVRGDNALGSAIQVQVQDPPPFQP